MIPSPWFNWFRHNDRVKQQKDKERRKKLHEKAVAKRKKAKRGGKR